jgi:hydroxymethylpyrimidine/phosphomethylpyrimidine kinase
VTGATIAVALTIAGSDSSGGAGISADLKAFARCGVHGTCALTAVTAQNTFAVDAVAPVAPEVVLAQVRAVTRDLEVGAVKVGMLASAAVAEAVAEALHELDDDVPVVVDPVLVSSSGAALLDAAGQKVLIERVIPRATVLTPNLLEARALVGGNGDAPELLRALLASGAHAVVLTGGHGLGREMPKPAGAATEVVDLFAAAQRPQEVVEITGPRQSDAANHGSGCTHSAVLAARLARGDSPLAAARVARRLSGLAVANGHAELGAGAGPVDVLGLECRDR